MYNGAKKRNKVFFIIETSQVEKVRDIIKSRLNVFQTEKLESNHYKQIFLESLHKEQIAIEQQAMEYIISIPNLYISTIHNIVQKSKLLNHNKITLDNIDSLCSFINFNSFDDYFSMIHKDIKGSCDILLRLYEDGYDISDIYFYMYDYIKNQKKTELFGVIEVICFYINQIYDGNYNKIMLVIFTYEIQSKLYTENKLSL